MVTIKLNDRVHTTDPWVKSPESLLFDHTGIDDDFFYYKDTSIREFWFCIPPLKTRNLYFHSKQTKLGQIHKDKMFST